MLTFLTMLISSKEKYKSKGAGLEAQGHQSGTIKIKPWILLSLVLGATGILYSKMMDLKLFADDFAPWHAVSKADSWADLLFLTYNPEFYRPLEMLLIKVNQVLLGDNSALYHTVALVGHIGVTFLIYKLAKRFSFTEPGAILASLFFGLSQANAMAVLGNDSAGQIFSALFGLWAIFLFLKENPAFADSALAALLLFVSLLWKDSGTSYALCLFVIIAWKFLPGKEFKRIFILALPIIFVVAIYLLMRNAAGAVGPDIGNEGRYQMWFGMNVPKNILLLFGAMATPLGSTLLLNQGGLPMAILGIGAVMGVFAFGLWLFIDHRQEKRQIIILTSILMLCLFLPDYLINHVSELYAYKPNALFATLLGVAVARIYSWTASKNALLSFMVALAIALLLMMNVASVRHKEQRMRVNGEYASKMLAQIQAQVPTVPEGAQVFIYNRDAGSEIVYSVFYMRSISLIGAGEFFEAFYGHKPYAYKQIDPNQLDESLKSLKRATLVVGCGKGEVQAKLINP